MTVRTAILPALDKVRSILGPTVMDLRPTSVTIVTRTWSGGRRGVGTASDATVALPTWVKVRMVTAREIAQSGGRYEQGDLRIGPITPAFTDSLGNTGGFTEAQLAPKGAQGVEIIYKLAQQAGASGIAASEAYLVEMRRDKSFRFELIVGKLRTTPGLY